MSPTSWRRRGLALVAFGASTLAAVSALAANVTVGEHDPSLVGAPATLRVVVDGAVGAVTVTWIFGDGSQAPAAADATEVTHVYAKAGHYPVIATVKDDQGTKAVSFLQTVHHPPTSGMPTRSTTIAFDAARHRVYAVNGDSDGVAILDADRLEKIAEVPTLRGPSSVALAPDGRLWVLHDQDYAIAIVDVDQAAMVGAVGLPYASQPAGLAMSPRGDVAFVTLRATGQLLELDAATAEVRAAIEVGHSPEAVAVSHDGARVLVSRFISPVDRGELYDVRVDPFALFGMIELAADPGPDTDTSGRGIPNYLSAVAISPDGLRAFVGAKKDNTLRGAYTDGQPLTPENAVRSMVGQIDLGAGQEDLAVRLDFDNRNLPSAIVFSDRGDYVFVAAQGNDLVEVLDAYNATPVALIPDVGSAPDGLALSPDGRLFVHALVGRSVRVYDVRPILDSVDFSGALLATIPIVESEKLSPEVLEGKRIFYDSEDPRMSRQGYLSCASCHLGGFEDGRVFDFTDRGEGLRNTVSMLGRRGTGHGRVHWSGNFDEIQDFENDIRNAFGGTGLMSDEDFQSGTHSQTLGDPKAGLSAHLDALAAYVTSLDHVRSSPLRNEDGTMTPDAIAGREIFVRLACDGCHAGPDFTDSAKGTLHDVGTITPASGQRLGGELTGIDTPTLLGVWETAPYLHDGSAATVRDVLTTKNPDDLHGVTSALSNEELVELEAYVLQLDSDLPVRTLPSFPTPTAADPGCACRTGGAPANGRAALLALVALAWASWRRAAEKPELRARPRTRSPARAIPGARRCAGTRSAAR